MEGHEWVKDRISLHPGSEGMRCERDVSAERTIAQIREVYGERTGVTKNIELIVKDCK